MSISIVALITFAVLVMFAAALSVSKSDTLDTMLYIGFYSGMVVFITVAVTGLISGLL